MTFITHQYNEPYIIDDVTQTLLRINLVSEDTDRDG